MEPTPSKSILEIGCGIGSNTLRLAAQTGMATLGLDLCESFVGEAKRGCKAPNLQFICGDFLTTEVLAESSFDYVVGNGILHHLHNQIHNAAASIYRLLKPGGKLIFLEPNILNPYVYLIFTIPLLRSKASLEPEEMAFSAGFADTVLKTAGFDEISVEYKDFLIPGIPSALVRPSIVLGDFLEKIPFAKHMSQSIFITARKTDSPHP